MNCCIYLLVSNSKKENDLQIIDPTLSTINLKMESSSFHGLPFPRVENCLESYPFIHGSFSHSNHDLQLNSKY